MCGSCIWGVVLELWNIGRFITKLGGSSYNYGEFGPLAVGLGTWTNIVDGLGNDRV